MEASARTWHISKLIGPTQVPAWKASLANRLQQSPYSCMSDQLLSKLKAVGDAAAHMHVLCIGCLLSPSTAQ